MILQNLEGGVMSYLYKLSKKISVIFSNFRDEAKAILHGEAIFPIVPQL